MVLTGNHKETLQFSNVLDNNPIRSITRSKFQPLVNKIKRNIKEVYISAILMASVILLRKF